MRRHIVSSIMVLVALVAVCSIAVASRAGEVLPAYVAAKVKQACTECWGKDKVAHIDPATLRRLVSAPCSHVQATAIYALGEIRDRDSVATLRAMLNHPNANLRYSAAHALGKIGDKRAVASLLEVLNAPDEKVFVRRAAARSLGKIAN